MRSCQPALGLELASTLRLRLTASHIGADALFAPAVRLTARAKMQARHEISFTRGAVRFEVRREDTADGLKFVGYRDGAPVAVCDRPEWACRALLVGTPGIDLKRTG